MRNKNEGGIEIIKETKVVDGREVIISTEVRPFGYFKELCNDIVEQHIKALSSISWMGVK